MTRKSKYSGMFCRQVVIVTGLVVLLGSSIAEAGELRIPIVAYSSEIDEDSLTTLSMEVDGLAELSGKKILYAQMKIGLASDTCDDPMNELSIQPIGGSETASTRMNPWKASMDNESQAVTRWSHAASIRGDVAAFCMTELVQWMSDGKLMISGFVIRPKWRGCAYQLGALTDSRDGQIGELIVKYVEHPQ